MSLPNGGVMPVQLPTEQSVGPHVVLLTGYDDEADTAPYDRHTGAGAFQVRNSSCDSPGRTFPQQAPAKEKSQFAHSRRIAAQDDRG
jgi:hypothetical protein